MINTCEGFEELVCPQIVGGKKKERNETGTQKERQFNKSLASNELLSNSACTTGIGASTFSKPEAFPPIDRVIVQTMLPLGH